MSDADIPAPVSAQGPGHAPSSSPAPPPDSDAGSQSAVRALQSVLTADEQLEAWAIQRRVFALHRRRLIVGATSGRLLAVTRPLFGGFDLTDIRWQDLREVHIHVGVLCAQLQVTAYTSPDLSSAYAPTRSLSFEGLRKQQAEALYRICQANDQAWREKRRIRDLEELRARAGGIQLGQLSPAGAGGPGPPGAATAGAEDAATRLRRARSMLDAGLISDSEYEAIKARIINSV